MDQLERERSESRNPSAMEQLSRDPSDRKRFLRMVGGAGAVGAFSIFLAACGDDEKKTPAATTQKPASGGDVKIVQGLADGPGGEGGLARSQWRAGMSAGSSGGSDG